MISLIVRACCRQARTIEFNWNIYVVVAAEGDDSSRSGAYSNMSC